jgi:cytoskeleton protein RodZ
MDRLLPDPSSKFHTPANVPLQMDRGAAFGEFLRTARERRGLTIQQISQETKIPWRHLDALEHGNLNAVPGGVYRRGEIRAYAHVVGLDEKVALAQLERALEPPAPPPEESRPISPHVSPVRLPARRVTLFAVGVLAGVAIGAVIIAERRAAVSGEEPLPISAPSLESRAVPGPATLSDQRSDARPAMLDVPAQPDRPSAAAENPVNVTAAENSVNAGNTEAAPPEAVTQPEQPAGPANPDGALVVSTDPPGARVTVNGIGYGVTPVTIRYLPFGDARIRVSHEGYSTEEHVVRVDKQRPASIHVLMTSGQ